jgi:predicted short-subunit dehydrogenase-like oxidoreductase (DUF2520 family)
MAVRGNSKPAIAIVGAGNLGSALSLALSHTRYRVSEIVSRQSASSRKRAAALARRIGARRVVLEKNEILAEVIWLCVPDRDITSCAKALARSQCNGRIALHSSGAFGSDALQPLHERGLAVASVHPLMTFVPGVVPSFRGVPFAVEGDQEAVTTARNIVSSLGGKSYLISHKDKSLYHAWATFTSPLLTILLEAAERVACAAHVSPSQARRRAAPILHQTVENYVQQGAARGFSGPIIRGDAATVRRHLKVLRTVPGTREVYVALARSALKTLPVRNRSTLKKLLR